MRRSVSATARRSGRRLITWRPKVRGTADVDVWHLISPLRYDILVRAQFFSFLSSRPTGESENCLVEASMSEPYHVWFRHVAMRRFRPWVLRDEDLLRQQFGERVLSARALWRSFDVHGFDRRRPVTLRASREGDRTDSGVTVGRRLHIGDGGHRLALLLGAGQGLAAGYYLVDPRPAVTIDNTAVLVRLLEIPEREYVRFLSRGYLDDEHEDLGSLRADVAAREPRLLTELDAVVRAHGRERPVA